MRIAESRSALRVHMDLEVVGSLKYLLRLTKEVC